MSKHVLSKSTFIRAQQCQKSLYLHKKRPFLRDKLSAEQLAKFKRGTDVGELAQSLFPGGLDMRPKSPSQYKLKRDETAEALNNPNVNILYEAVFQFDEVLIMLDILVRDGKKWIAYEVKSSLAISSTYLKDAALQYYVLNGCGIELSDFCLIYVNKDYHYSDTLVLEELFINQSVMNEVKMQEQQIKKEVYESKQTLQLSNSPEIKIGRQCNYPYPCDFIGHCWKNVPQNNILNLSTFDQDLLFELYHQGVQNIEDFPKNKIQNEVQDSELQAFLNNSLVFDKNMLVSFQEQYPIKKYKDIVFVKVLTNQPAVPSIIDTYPYQALPLAVAYSNKSGTHTKSIAFGDNENALLAFYELILELNDTDKLIVTDDETHFKKCLEGLTGYYNNKINITPFLLENEVIGLNELIRRANIFHPALCGDKKLLKMETIITGKRSILKDEIFLKNDLIQNNELEKQSLALDGLMNYVKVIEKIFEFINQLNP